jgi:hypothetical protein
MSISKIDKHDPKASNFRYTKDGALIEAVAEGGLVYIVQKEVQFLRDVVPYFAPSFVIIFAHIIYMYTGNLLLPVWLMYLITPIN